MTEEKSLKMEGEELAKVALDSGMGSTQLRTIYKLIKTKPLAYVEAFVQRQMGRQVRGCGGFARVLEFLRKYGGQKGAAERVLMYAVMLYDYYEKKPIIGLKIAGEPIIRRVVEGHDSVFDNVTMRLHGKILEVDVKVNRFHGNPKVLAMNIEKALKGKEEFSNLNIRVWIKSQ